MGAREPKSPRRQSRCATLVALALLAVAPSLSAATEFTSVKPVMLEALNAPGGTANGVLVGPIADKFAASTGSAAPVVVEVTTLKSFKQEGCKRLNVRLKQANVPTKEGKLAEFGVDYSLNLCRDGSAPTEGMAQNDVGKTR